MTKNKITLRKRVSTLLAMALVGIFLYQSFSIIGAHTEESLPEEETEETELVRSGGGPKAVNIIAVSALFIVLVFIGFHAYSTQIHPSK